MKAATLMKIEKKEQEKKWFCPSCKGEMYRLPGSLNSIYICQKCGCSIEPGNIEIGFKNEDSEENQNLEGVNVGKKQLNRLFTPQFMKKYTKYDNFADFIISSKLIPKDRSFITYELFKTIPLRQLNEYIKGNTIFDSWDEMFDKATGRYLRI